MCRPVLHASFLFLVECGQKVGQSSVPVLHAVYISGSYDHKPCSPPPLHTTTTICGATSPICASLRTGSCSTCNPQIPSIANLSCSRLGYARPWVVAVADYCGLCVSEC
ncbi:hypothetical protein Hypma_011839 [Hypsizygus marmoreus]|uniref:Secreted protein n=1 Tax=Hypsizygus marmoreus TaxID=39966 RepID=A0A369JL07_HYPMA|nr:hypothetical protein Hypma_011839 [Hypsizygus marmoreus]